MYLTLHSCPSAVDWKLFFAYADTFTVVSWYFVCRILQFCVLRFALRCFALCGYLCALEGCLSTCISPGSLQVEKKKVVVVAGFLYTFNGILTTLTDFKRSEVIIYYTPAEIQGSQPASMYI